MVKPVAIYVGEGASSVGVDSLQRTVPKYLNLPVELISATQIIEGQLTHYTMLIMPGGADLPYCNALNGKGNLAIREFVEQGGVYLGICAGAYYACQAIDFVGREYAVKGERELAFFDGVAQGCLPQWTRDNRFDLSVHSKNRVTLTFSTQEKQVFYYHGGPKFMPNSTACYNAIAYYPDGELAMVSGKIGLGHYFLSGVHFELHPEAYQRIVEQSVSADKEEEQKLQQFLQHQNGEFVWKIIAKMLV